MQKSDGVYFGEACTGDKREKDSCAMWLLIVSEMFH